MRDFTLEMYKILLTELIKTKYKFITFAEFIQNNTNTGKIIILRHDVDRLPEQALKMAEIEHEMGVKTTYYFRCQPNGFEMNFIKDIAALGYEIGYHYETMDSSRGNIENAFNEFKKNLEKLRKLVPVSTICMHGSPRSKFNNRDLWSKYDYRDFEIIGEPYFDLDYNMVLYLTDTGRCWNGNSVSLRDKIVSASGLHRQYLFKHTTDVIDAVKAGRFPNQSMLTVHPQRWTDNYVLWIKELVWQKTKNPLKYLKLKRMGKINKK